MTENWQAGDLALCICDDWAEPGRPTPPCAPRKGQILTVIEPFMSRRFHNLYLRFQYKPGNAWQAEYFIKVTPSPEVIAEERRVEVDA